MDSPCLPPARAFLTLLLPRSLFSRLYFSPSPSQTRAMLTLTLALFLAPHLLAPKSHPARLTTSPHHHYASLIPHFTPPPCLPHPTFLPHLAFSQPQSPKTPNLLYHPTPPPTSTRNVYFRYHHYTTLPHSPNKDAKSPTQEAQKIKISNLGAKNHFLLLQKISITLIFLSQDSAKSSSPQKSRIIL